MQACSSVDVPWVDTTDVFDSTPKHRYGAKHVVVVGEFSNPSANPIGWSDIGRKFSQQVRQKLSQRSDLEPREDSALAARAQAAIALSGSARESELKSIGKQWPGVRFVMTGRIVDFRHATHSPSDLSRWDDPRNTTQAIVTARVDMVDLHERRLIPDSQIQALAWADRTPTDQTYRGMSFGSQRFWSTPLGMASRDAIDQCAARFDQAAPVTAEPPIRIVQRLGGRRVQLNDDAKSLVKSGDLLWVCEYDKTGGKLQPVIDPVTRQPLQARVESRIVEPTAWLVGEPPASVNLMATVLTASRP